jgi:hypothetical protein
MHADSTMGRLQKPDQGIEESGDKIGDRLLTRNDQLILDKDYPRVKTDREAAIGFANQQRGSMRYVLGLFRTEDEQEQFLNDGLKLKLPKIA